MEKSNLRYYYGQYRMAYKRNLNHLESLDYFRYEIVGMFGETFYNNLVEMYDSIAWITDYRIQKRRLWDIYEYSDIGKFNFYGAVTGSEQTFCNCDCFYGYQCPVHDYGLFVIDDIQF